MFCAGAGVRLPPGEYHLKMPKDRDNHHMHLKCKSDGDDRTSPFILDLSNTFLWLTVRIPAFKTISVPFAA